MSSVQVRFSRKQDTRAWAHMFGLQSSWILELLSNNSEAQVERGSRTSLCEAQALCDLSYVHRGSCAQDVNDPWKALTSPPE